MAKNFTRRGGHNRLERHREIDIQSRAASAFTAAEGSIILLNDHRGTALREVMDG